MTIWQESIDSTPGETLRARSGIVVSRFHGTVVVTIHGDLDGPRAGDMGYMLADLIDGQGNRSVIVDLRDATAIDPQWLSVFDDAVARAGRRGASLKLNDAPAELEAALRRHGLDRFIDRAVQSTSNN
jgi:anti-anti-sigma regulatory factor